MKLRLTLMAGLCILLAAKLAAQGFIANPSTFTTVSNGGHIVVNNGDFILKSSSQDAAGTASLLIPDATSTVIVNGSGHEILERYLVQDDWHFVSSPLSDGQAGVFLDQYLRTLIESTNEWGNWIVPVNTPLVPGTGYACWPVESKAFIFSGTFNNGDVSPAVTFTDPAHGMNFVGNPYPSAINWDASSGWTKTNIWPTIWIWNPVDSAYGTYNTGTSVHGISNIIPAGQGFIIAATAADPVLSMNNSVRVHNTAQSFLKRGSTPSLRLRVDGNNHFDEIVVRIMPGSIYGLDKNYDAPKLSGDPQVPQMYLKKEGAPDQVVIGSYPEFPRTLEIPVGLQVSVPGNCTITASEMETISSSISIYLEDLMEKTTQDLRLNPVYSFSSLPEDAADRFILHFSNPSYGTGDLDGQDPVQIWSDGHSIYVRNQDQEGKVFVYDLLGRMFYEDNISAQPLTKLTPDLITGCYLVRLTNGSGTYTEKIVIRN